MTIVCLHEKRELAAYFEQDPYLHLYSLGDLDDFLWPQTVWYGLRVGSGRGSRLEAVVQVYAGPGLPTVVALGEKPDAPRDLLGSIAHLLPHAFYAHLTPSVESALAGTYETEFFAPHQKMALTDTRAHDALGPAGSSVESLGPDDAPALSHLYEVSYPGNWFDPRMLETGQFFGIRDGTRLIAAGGVHVYSREYRVAALGNITTHPDLRGRGYGTAVTAALCRSLTRQGIRVGLNVQADNAAAIASYRKVGFSTVATYGEFTMRHR